MSADNLYWKYLLVPFLSFTRRIFISFGSLLVLFHDMFDMLSLRVFEWLLASIDKKSLHTGLRGSHC